MKSSSTSNWESITRQKPLLDQRIREEALITSSTRELVEFYWSNRKRFSGSYAGFPAKINKNV
tara:strand:- start:403 stop:591 length:189 start_codon:yes stop_codon:yes gene_type:complete